MLYIIILCLLYININFKYDFVIVQLLSKCSVAVFLKYENGTQYHVKQLRLYYTLL